MIRCLLFIRSRLYVCVSKRRSEVFGDFAGGVADVATLERFDYRQMPL